MRRVWLLAGLAVLACTDRAADSGAKLLPVDSLPAATGRTNLVEQELIPAEWTVFEDTSETGEVTTASMQLPAAKEIEDLLDEGGPRLVLRCVDRKVQASIDIEPTHGIEPAPDSGWVQAQTVEIQLDSAPPCE